MSTQPPANKSYKMLIILNILLVVSVCVIVYCAININNVLLNQSINYRSHLQYHIANDYFRYGSDMLTDAVRRYAFSQDIKYMDAYFEEFFKLRHREKALERTQDLEIDQELKNYISRAMRFSKNLMQTEYHAMHLVNEGSGSPYVYEEVNHYRLTPQEQNATHEERCRMAQNLLWSEQYIHAKKEIYSSLSGGLERASVLVMKRHRALRTKLNYLLIAEGLSLAILVIAIFGFILRRRSENTRLIAWQANETMNMNKQLQAERDKAIAAENAKSFFFSTVSHDIRTPLNAIIGFSEMLQMGIDNPEEKKKALDSIVISGHTLLELVNDVLDLSKLEAGKMEFHPEPTNIAKLVKGVTTSFEIATMRNSVLLRVEVEEMPYLKLDPQRIRQILFNLIGNAVKFTKKGSIIVRASYKNEEFSMSVTDTGCGIADEDKKKLMSPYVQLRGRGNNDGTGLGLAICKQLANQMKGTLEVDSVLGQGSTFTLRVPKVIAFSQKDAKAYFETCSKHKETSPELDTSIQEKQILIVNDSPLNLAVLKAMLGRLNIQNIVTASNGKEALEKLLENRNVEIVLTDMFMPVMDGEELVREIRKIPELEKLPVYAITADVEMQNTYMKKGFDNVLLKPITLEKLKVFLA